MKQLNFIAIDFETANDSRASICSIGLVKVVNGSIIDEIHTYIDPQDEFTYRNTEIHGITEEMVIGSPTFEEYWPTFKGLIENEILMAHNASFDMSALRYALNKLNEPCAVFTYGCSFVFAKKVWPSLYNHKLSTMANHLGISFKHHDALEDARVSAFVTLAALNASGVESLDDLSNMHNLQLGVQKSDGYTPAGVKKRKKSTVVSAPKKATQQVNKSHPFYNKTVVFTGKLQAMTRGEASEKVMNCGGNCANHITINTHYLVIGDYDLTSYAEIFNSTKMRKVEELVNKGYSIEIVGESDFLRIIREFH